MVYVTHTSPTTRTSDTFTGKIIGWLEEYLFWLDIEGKCNFIDAVIPEVFIIGQIDNLLITIFKKHYEANYQKVYNQGADRGNSIHQQIFGKFDSVIADYKKRISDASSELFYMIQDAKKQISGLNSKIFDFDAKIRSFTSKMADFDSRTNQALTDVKNLQGEVNNLVVRVNDTIAKMNNAVKNFDSKMDAFEGRLAEADKWLDKHTAQINELFDRVKTLESKTRAWEFKIPTLKELIP